MRGGAEDFGLHSCLPGACTILLINRFMRGFVNISVLMGMGLGYAIAGGMGMVDLGGLAERPPWFDIVTPLHFGAPTFDLAPILSMCLVVVIIFVESTGMFLALGKITGREDQLDRNCAAACTATPAPVLRRFPEHLHPFLVRPEHRPADDRGGAAASTSRWPPPVS